MNETDESVNRFLSGKCIFDPYSYRDLGGKEGKRRRNYKIISGSVAFNVYISGNAFLQDTRNIRIHMHSYAVGYISMPFRYHLVLGYWWCACTRARTRVQRGEGEEYSTRMYGVSLVSFLHHDRAFYGEGRGILAACIMHSNTHTHLRACV